MIYCYSQDCTTDMHTMNCVETGSRVSVDAGLLPSNKSPNSWISMQKPVCACIRDSPMSPISILKNRDKQQHLLYSKWQKPTLHTTIENFAMHSKDWLFYLKNKKAFPVKSFSDAPALQVHAVSQETKLLHVLPFSLLFSELLPPRAPISSQVGVSANSDCSSHSTNVSEQARGAGKHKATPQKPPAQKTHFVACQKCSSDSAKLGRNPDNFRALLSFHK